MGFIAYWNFEIYLSIDRSIYHDVWKNAEIICEKVHKWRKVSV